MKVRTMDVHLRVKTDASVRDLREPGYWDHCKSSLRALLIEQVAVRPHGRRRHKPGPTTPPSEPVPA